MASASGRRSTVAAKLSPMVSMSSGFAVVPCAYERADLPVDSVTVDGVMVAGEAPARRPPRPPSGLFGLRPVHASTLRLRRPRLLASLSLYTQRGPVGTAVGSASRFGGLVPRADPPHTAAIWSPDAAVEGGRACLFY